MKIFKFCVHEIGILSVLFLSFLQVIIGIGAKPAVSPFERVGLESSVGGIQVHIQIYAATSCDTQMTFSFFFF